MRIQSIVKADPDDDVVLATAFAAGVDYIVSGDKPLLALREYAGIPIVTPRVFLDVLEETYPN